MVRDIIMSIIKNKSIVSQIIFLSIYSNKINNLRRGKGRRTPLILISISFSTQFSYRLRSRKYISIAQLCYENLNMDISSVWFLWNVPLSNKERRRRRRRKKKLTRWICKIHTTEDLSSIVPISEKCLRDVN